MESLCDELILLIFHRLPPNAFSAVSLVSKRWLRLLRCRQTSLCLTLPLTSSTVSSLSSFLSRFTHLSSLVVKSVSGHSLETDKIGLCVATSCPTLQSLKLSAGIISQSTLIRLGTSCSRLTSLDINLGRPISFQWIISSKSLTHLSIHCSKFFLQLHNSKKAINNVELNNGGKDIGEVESNLESLTLNGAETFDNGFNWLWGSCRRLKKLCLWNCKSVLGLNSWLLNFQKCLDSLEAVEIRNCRTVVDILMNLTKSCTKLTSLLIYDEGTDEGILQFITQSKCKLEKVKLRLPCDLYDHHLISMAKHSRGLSTLSLQSCALITGEGLTAVCTALTDTLEELVLKNCYAIETEVGLLSTLGQKLRRLKKLDLSYNWFRDDELRLMLDSCGSLRELKLRSCRKVTSDVLVSTSRNCTYLESLNIMNCELINKEAIEVFVVNSPQLRYLIVEDSKISDVARNKRTVKFLDDSI